jgi:molybdopterin-guanine dinucleotide biosynthesis protein A
MGRDKALVVVAGAPLVVRPVAALEAAGAARILAVGGDLGRLRTLGIEAVTDDHPGDGPLGGILTAFRHADGEPVVVLACDLPEIDGPVITAVLDALAASPGAAVAWPEVGGTAHVLVAAWRPAVATAHLATAFASGERSVRRAAGALTRVVVDGVPATALRNANRPGDLTDVGRPADGTG